MFPLITHCDRDKMAAISQTVYSNAFSWMHCLENFTEIRSHRSNQQYSSIGSDNGLAPVSRQSIIWNNNGLVYWRIYASPGLNELIIESHYNRTIMHFGMWSLHSHHYLLVPMILSHLKCLIGTEVKCADIEDVLFWSQWFPPKWNKMK